MCTVTRGDIAEYHPQFKLMSDEQWERFKRFYDASHSQYVYDLLVELDIPEVSEKEEEEEVDYVVNLYQCLKCGNKGFHLDVCCEQVTITTQISKAEEKALKQASKFPANPANLQEIVDPDGSFGSYGLGAMLTTPQALM